MKTPVEQFAALVGTPGNAVPRQDWSEIAGEMGCEIPEDYRQFIDVYGGGQLDGYLWVLEPRCAKSPYDLIRLTEECDEAFALLWEDGEAPPQDLLRAPGSRVIPWATTDNGEFLYWLAAPGAHPARWPVLVNEARGAWWERFDVGCADLLVGLLSGEIRSEILSRSFPLPRHTFEEVGRF
ncbi:SMI1/KNR4 family protein [Streptomyces sp. NPDC091281]|uniref:SMI1/KNR4 family protein n=1 Tax=Streptomyces sp. NPDC091281 TaxID=3365985 RepID=UPI00381A3C06